MPAIIGYRARQVVEIVNLATVSGERPPSYADIARSLGFNSVADVCNVVRRLEKRGLLQRTDTGARYRKGWHEPVILTQTT